MMTRQRALALIATATNDAAAPRPGARGWAPDDDDVDQLVNITDDGTISVTVTGRQCSVHDPQMYPSGNVAGAVVPWRVRAA